MRARMACFSTAVEVTAGTVLGIRGRAVSRIEIRVGRRRTGASPARVRLLGLRCAAFQPGPRHTPRLMKVCLHDDSSNRLSALLEFAIAESNGDRPGSRSVLLRIAELVFVEVLRSYLTTAAEDSASWLRGLRDPIVGRALARLHAQPARAGLCLNSRTRPVPRVPCWPSASRTSWDIRRCCT
jgi:hypothetical protein